MKRDSLAHSYAEESLDTYRRPNIERERIGWHEVVVILKWLPVGLAASFAVWAALVLLTSGSVPVVP